MPDHHPDRTGGSRGGRLTQGAALLCLAVAGVIMAGAVVQAMPESLRALLQMGPRDGLAFSEPRGPERLRSVHGVGPQAPETEEHETEEIATLEGDAAEAFEPLPFDSADHGRIEPDPEWVEEHIVSAEVPVLGGHVRCHEQLIPQLDGALGELEERGLGHLVDPDQYGGCWAPRHILHEPERALSLHAWGVAVDLNVADNPYGAEPEMDSRVVDVFERWGFAWGGHWRTPDGMHFELRELREQPAAGGT